MPLIIAIEPDRRQASQLKRLTRGCGADLVLADTTERALEAIGNRIPDLVLVPALLSPQDDAAVATALRVIAAAAHVQTLTIPVFAAPVAPARGGVLAKWRRGRATPVSSQGCDPAVFAEQITAYLAEAAAAREALTPAPEEIDEIDEIAEEPARAAQPAEPAPSPPAESEAEWEPIVLEAEPIELIAEPIELVAEPIELVAEPIELEAEEEAVAPADADAPVVLETGEIDLRTFLAELEEPQPVVMDPEPVQELASEPVAQTAQTELWAALSLAPHRWPRLDAMLAEPHRITLAPDAAVAQPETVAAAPSRPESARPEWLDMLDALRHDIDRLRVQRTEAAAPAPLDRAQPVAPARPVAVAPAAPPCKQKRKKDPVPIQDEWGFFDPQQCGFTALLAKLDEISNSSQ